jgi:hypothetical protein
VKDFYKQYWIEATESALEDAGLIATSDQIQTIAEVMQGANENFGLASGLEESTRPSKPKPDKPSEEMYQAVLCVGRGRQISQMFYTDSAARNFIGDAKSGRCGFHGSNVEASFVKRVLVSEG